MRSIFQEKIVETEELIRKSATILSDLTNYTSILLGPDTSLHAVKRFSIVPLDEKTAVAIIVTDNGRVENRLFNVPEGFTASDIEKMVNILNERLVGTPLSPIFRNTCSGNENGIGTSYSPCIGDLFASFQQAISIEPEERLYFGGKMNMMKQPEFNDIQKMKTFFEFIGKRSTGNDVFSRRYRTGIHVRIGSENNHNAMEDCSVITATYSAGDNMTGSIAIIGPKRMDYARVITLLDLMSSDLSRELARLTIGGGTAGRKE